MRTTLTLEDSLFKQLKERARRSGESFKEVVNAALRRGLQAGAKPAPKLPRFEVKPRAAGFRPGVDPLRLNQLSDELEMADFQRKRASDIAKR